MAMIGTTLPFKIECRDSQGALQDSNPPPILKVDGAAVPLARASVGTYTAKVPTRGKTITIKWVVEMTTDAYYCTKGKVNLDV